MKLLTNPPGIQIVDGNNFLLHLLRQDQSGFAARVAVAGVRACLKPPLIVFDGPGGNDRRRARYPDYKTKRGEMGEDLFATMKFIRSLLAYVPCAMIQVPGYEADDVIGTMAISYATRGQKVHVLTTDRDLYQLAAIPGVEVAASYDHVRPEMVRAYKAVVGDPSDNIAGIPRFGEKAWEKIDQRALLRFLAERPVDLDKLPAIGFGLAHEKWVRDNLDLFLAGHDVTGLIQVPEDLMRKHMTIGSDRPSDLEKALKEFSL